MRNLHEELTAIGGFFQETKVTLVFVISFFVCASVTGQHADTVINSAGHFNSSDELAISRLYQQKHEVDSLERRIILKNHELDSLNRFAGKSTAIVNKEMAKLNKLRNGKLRKLNKEMRSLQASLRKLDPAGATRREFSKLNAEIALTTSSANKQLARKQDRLNKKLNRTKDKAAQGMRKTKVDSLFGGSVGNAKTNLNLPKLKSSELTNLERNSMSIPGTGNGLKLGNELSSGALKGTSLGNIGLSEPSLNVASIAGLAFPGMNKSELMKLKSYSLNVTQYQKQIAAFQKNLNEGKLESSIETGLENEFKATGPLKDLNAKNKELQMMVSDEEKKKKLVQQYQDKGFIKKQLKDKENQLAHGELQAGQGKVNIAIGNMTKLKKKYPEVRSIHDIQKKIPNSMYGKPITERLEPGFTLQFQKQQWIDLFVVPQIGYKISGRISAGIGATFRLRGTVADSFRVRTNNMVLGPKIYIQGVIKNGFFLRAEYEQIYAQPVSKDNLTLPYVKQSGFFIGTGKRFNISPRWKGTVQALYNLSYDKRKTPYANPINFRLGFYFNMRKAVKIQS